MPAQTKVLFAFLIALGAIFLFSIFPKTSLAAMSFTVDEIISHPSELPVGGQLEVRVSFGSVSGEKQYYLFLSFRKPESGAYNFGFTQNNDGDWIKYGDGFDNFYKIEIKESSWSGILKAKPDYEANGFKGEGEYQIRAGRYVSSSNATWTDSQDLRIFLKAPASTPTPTSEPDEKSEEESASATPTPTSIPTSNPTPKAIKVIGATLSGEVLGEESTPGGIYLLESSPSSEASSEGRKNNRVLPLVFLGTGLIFFVAAGLSLWYTKWRCPG